MQVDGTGRVDDMDGDSGGKILEPFVSTYIEKGSDVEEDYCA